MNKFVLTANDLVESLMMPGPVNTKAGRTRHKTTSLEQKAMLELRGAYLEENGTDEYTGKILTAYTPVESLMIPNPTVIEEGET